jgi:hypothetical protein
VVKILWMLEKLGKTPYEPLKEEQEGVSKNMVEK